MDVRLEHAVESLKRDRPLPKRVSVIVVPSIDPTCASNRYGEMNLFKRGFQIKIWDHVDIGVQIDTLWHEWAHCLLYPKCKYRHSKLFWTTYGRIYSRYLD
jgi:hypothetical protein